MELAKIPTSRPPKHCQDSFLYFAYGSCMCPVDLKRSLGENTHGHVVGPAILRGYRLGFLRRSRLRNCGVLDIVKDPRNQVHGVLYRLPWRLSASLDRREEGYCHHRITVECQGQTYANTRTYTVTQKRATETAPNEWYSTVVLRGATTCGLPEHYQWQLFRWCQRGYVSPRHRDLTYLNPGQAA